jgi:hypothetical protein
MADREQSHASRREKPQRDMAGSAKPTADKAISRRSVSAASNPAAPSDATYRT